jgi:spore coat protein U-like protein
MMTCATRRLRLSALLALVTLLPHDALAAVCGTVRVNATNVGFGNYNPGSPSDDTATGTIVVRCQGSPFNTLPAFTVDLSTGGAGSYTPRRMLLGLSQLFYNLYTSAGYTTIWGDGTGGSGNIASAGGVNTQNFTVYGRIPTGQFVAAGNYSDTITVTVTY